MSRLADPLRTTGEPLLWAWVYAATGFLYVANAVFAYGATVAMVAALFATIPAGLLLGSLYGLESSRREPVRVRVWALLWGGLVAVAVAGTINSLVSATLGEAASALISAPVFEELTKAAGLLLLVRWKALRTPMDGVLLGAYVGAGFAVAEDLLYFAEALASDLNQESVGAFAETLLARTLTPFGHSFFTLLVGAGIGMRVQRGSRSWPAIGIGAAMLLHFAWNFGAYTENVGILLGGFLPLQLLTLGAVLLVVLAEWRRIRNNLALLSPLDRDLIRYRRPGSDRTQKIANQILRREALRRAIEKHPKPWPLTAPHPAGAAHLHPPVRWSAPAPETRTG